MFPCVVQVVLVHRAEGGVPHHLAELALRPRREDFVDLALVGRDQAHAVALAGEADARRVREADDRPTLLGDDADGLFGLLAIAEDVGEETPADLLLLTLRNGCFHVHSPYTMEGTYN